MMNRLLRCGFSVSAVLAVSGCCGAPQVLVAQESVGRRVVRYALVPSSRSSEDVGPLFDLKVVICNQEEGGAETACIESVVLADVVPGAE